MSAVWFAQINSLQFLSPTSAISLTNMAQAYSYAELAISSSSMTETVAAIHCDNPRRDGQAECAQLTWLYTEIWMYDSTPVLK